MACNITTTQAGEENNMAFEQADRYENNMACNITTTHTVEGLIRQIPLRK